MKKSLFAMAAVTAFAGAAQAQSSVTVYGILDVGFAATQNDVKATSAASTTANVARNTGNGDGGLSTSRLGFRGVEDLGGGKSAQFQLEYDLVNVGMGGTGTDSNLANTTTNNGTATNGFGARYAYVGLSDKALGTIRLGRQEQAVFTVLSAHGLAGYANNMAGTIYSSGTNTAVNSASVRPVTVFVNQAITYISPTIAGFQATAQFAQNARQTGSTDRYNGVRESGGSITYTGVKNLQVGYGIALQDSDATAVATFVDATLSAQATYVTTAASTKTLQQVAAVNYDFGVVRPFVNYTQLKVETAGLVTRDQQAYEVGVRAPITSTVGVWASGFMGSKTNAGNETSLGNSTSGRANIQGWQLGAMYALSKRTTTYAIYGTQNLKGKDAADNTKIDTTGYTVGVRHSF